MASRDQQNTKKLTYEEVEAWRTKLFEERSLLVPVEQLTEWSLIHYLWAAVLQAVHLDKNRDESDQNWQTPAWDFGRFAKAHPELVNLSEGKALDAIKRTIGSSFWKDHFHMDTADAEMAFDNIWAECRAIPGYDPLTIAILEAKSLPIKEDPSVPAGYAVFLNIARSLSKLQAGAPFMLPCHTLAPRLNCQPMTISRYRQKAIRDGHLRIVKGHSFRSSGKGEATEFMLAT
jgi:hypothetical protein